MAQETLHSIGHMASSNDQVFLSSLVRNIAISFKRNYQENDLLLVNVMDYPDVYTYLDWPWNGIWEKSFYSVIFSKFICRQFNPEIFPSLYSIASGLDCRCLREFFSISFKLGLSVQLVLGLVSSGQNRLCAFFPAFVKVASNTAAGFVLSTWL